MLNTSIAIIGATGLVGTTLLKILEERAFPIENLYLLASKQSDGKTLKWREKEYSITDLKDFDFSQSQLAFFCVGNDLAAKYVPIAAKAGNIVIDKSSYFRRDPSVPLVIPEVNAAILKNIQAGSIIASPNCNTIPIAVGLKPIYDQFGLNRVNISTYQSVSGTGKDAIVELTDQTRHHLDNQPFINKIYPQQIAFNVLPHIDEFEENGYTREEMKIVWEMKKIFADESLAINPTAVRVPVYCGHAAAVHLESKKKMNQDEVEAILQNAPGIKVITGDYPYPTPVKDAAGRDPVFIGRIRKDISHPYGLNLWIVADNLRKGAALNAVQIAELLLRRLHT